MEKPINEIFLSYLALNVTANCFCGNPLPSTQYCSQGKQWREISQLSWDSNPGLLGGEQECCATQPPSSFNEIIYNSFQQLSDDLEKKNSSTHLENRFLGFLQKNRNFRFPNKKNFDFFSFHRLSKKFLSVQLIDWFNHLHAILLPLGWRRGGEGEGAGRGVNGYEGWVVGAGRGKPGLLEGSVGCVFEPLFCNFYASRWRRRAGGHLPEFELSVEEAAERELNLAWYR